MTTRISIFCAGALAFLPMTEATDAEDTAPTPPPESGQEGDPLADFLALAARSAAPAEHEERPAATFSEHVPEACLFALACADAIAGDRDAASTAFLMIAERLSEKGAHKDALAVIERIPDYRRLIAAVDLALRASHSRGLDNPVPLEDEALDWNAIMAEMVENHSLSLTFREEGEVLVREAQWAARQGSFDRVEALFSRLRNFATLEYLARAEARVGIEKAREGLAYDFDALVSAETLDPLMGRALPDFMAHIGRAQFEVALLEIDRAEDEGGQAKARERVRAALSTAQASRVFIGDLLVDACAELTGRGEADFAKVVFLERAPGIGALSNSVAVKPVLLARLAPLYQQWAEDFDPGKLLDAAEAIAAKQHAVNRARSLASIGGAWEALGHGDRALALWEESLALIAGMPNEVPRMSTLAWLAVEMSWHRGEFPDSLRESLMALKPTS